MVLVDIEIALSANLEIEGAVACHQLEHVIEKTDSGAHVVAALAFDADTDANLRLARSSVDYGTAHRPSSASIDDLGVAHDTGGDTDAAAAAGVARSIADENASIGEGTGRSLQVCPIARR